MAAIDRYNSVVENYDQTTCGDEDLQITDAISQKKEIVPFSKNYIFQWQFIGTLDGQIKYPAHQISEKVCGHLDLAKKIVEYIQKTILFSTNYHCKFFPELTGGALDDFNQKSALFGLVRKYNTSKLDEIVGFAMKYNMGNCSEMAAVGFKYAKTHLPDVNVEIFQIQKGDHVFLVLGRDPNSDPSDYKNWGADTVICDPWAKAYYPVDQLEKYLMDYIASAVIGGELRAIVQPFNPFTQSLEIQSLT